MNSKTRLAQPDQLKMLKALPATPENLQGYGWAIGPDRTPVWDKIDFYKEVEVRQPANFHSNEDTCLNLVSFAPRDLTVRWMEYHMKHTQTFIPLSGQPFYMVLGKATHVDPQTGSITEPENALPDPETVQAFYFDGSAGIVMDVGVWHEVPFPAQDKTHFVCICTNETNDNLEAQGADGDCDGGDLTKRNIAKHFGYTFAVDPS